ncbi:metallophosphoesterase [Novosphingobium sp. P6W]|uniref:metallophosphoesterase n=1 Tax=Novosphingobium sp. P6W TaxID=1609758 RepID=UPI0005C3059A|nr:metallophosphoesterase [Novosphingobium sp. P6W]AXB76169.1 serine/threonine protein phosphatase [Novosphingobium sp. P6W]KIS31452.1 serine/threonine protein phosphatase [Novosphingobium sp. P6W]
MISMIRNLLGRRDVKRTPSIPSGERVYAVGDIHGRADLFEDLILAIEQDDAARGRAYTTVVLLGDLIDRGHDSAAVVERARRWGSQRNVEFIQGNHEEMLLVSRDDTDALRSFLKFGGLETILSYGVDPEAASSAELDELQRLMNAAIPQDDIDFIDAFKKMVRIGDYVFVHAGVRPDTPLEHQSGRDCRWIREPFLSHRGDYGGFVVHGHTITPEPDVCTNRIGIDTGAFLHGTLTAIGLEGEERWFIQAHDSAAHSQAA